MDILVTVDHLAKSFGAHDIFDKVSFTIRQGEKLGLVGVNGSGQDDAPALPHGSLLCR